MSTKRVLGIDPGTGICGFGVVEYITHKNPRMITAGVITTPAHTPLADRLLDIYNSLNEIIDETHPDEVSIEKLYFNTNITTGITVRKEEIAIMKLIGAKDSFVRAPFIVEGIAIGLIGSIIPLVILLFMYKSVMIYVTEKFVFLRLFVA